MRRWRLLQKTCARSRMLHSAHERSAAPEMRCSPAQNPNLTSVNTPRLRCRVDYLESVLQCGVYWAQVVNCEILADSGILTCSYLSQAGPRIEIRKRPLNRDYPLGLGFRLPASILGYWPAEQASHALASDARSGLAGRRADELVSIAGLHR